MGKTYSSYEEAIRKSREHPDEFWAREAEKLHWFRKWDKVLDDSRAPFYRWFVGGRTNIAYNIMERNIERGRGDKPAVIYVSAETGIERTMTYRELNDDVLRLASVLRLMGIGKGDRVVVYLPNSPEAVTTLLACARIGAVHAVVFAGFSYEALAQRIDDCEPKLVITADASQRRGKPVPLKPIVDKALETARHKVPRVIIWDRHLAPFSRTDRDVLWHEVMPKDVPSVPAEPMESNDVLYLLYTSGTTGKPKGVVRDTGSHMVALHTSMEQIYGCTEKDIYWSTSDIGWTVGHAYIVYGPLLFGIPTVVFEGTPDYPDPEVWWRVVEKNHVTVMFSAPTAFRMLRKFPETTITSHDLSSLRYLFLAGEPLDVPTYEWATRVLGKPVIDHYWQTESGWPILTNSVGIEFLPIKPGSPTKPAMGYELAVVDEKGNELPPGTKGFLVAKPPFAPGTMLTLWKEDDAYEQIYWRRFPRLLYMTGDYAIRDEDGYYFVLGRSDEVINISGHRLGTREVEEVVSSHPAVAENSSIGVKDELRGEAVVTFAVLKQGFTPAKETADSIKALVREKIGPFAVPRDVQFVHALPKTRSGKIMRRVLKGIQEGKKLGDLTTIEDEASVDEIKRAVTEMEIGK